MKTGIVAMLVAMAALQSLAHGDNTASNGKEFIGCAECAPRMKRPEALTDEGEESILTRLTRGRGDIPDTPGRGDIPDTPGRGDIPDTPTTPGRTDTPATPGTHGGSEIPDTPGRSDAPGTPAATTSPTTTITTTPTEAQPCEQIAVRLCEALRTGNDYNTLKAGKNLGYWYNSGICRVVSTEDNLNLDQYIYSLDLYNANSTRGSQYGHLGVTFNGIDADNFEFVYFRPHRKDKWDCVQYGYMRSNTIYKKTQCACTNAKVRGSTWFNVKVTVKAGDAQVFVNDEKLLTVKPRFSSRSQAGVMVWNGCENTIRYRNAAISAM